MTFNSIVKKVLFLLQQSRSGVPKDAEFASMQSRVQSFKPANGKVKVNQAVELMNNFVSEAVSQDGEYIEKEYKTTPSKSGCMFCAFKQMRICSDAEL